MGDTFIKIVSAEAQMLTIMRDEFETYFAHLAASRAGGFT
jgi:hypothetical protein